jgi:hypothetical protein
MFVSLLTFARVFGCVVESFWTRAGSSLTSNCSHSNNIDLRQHRGHSSNTLTSQRLLLLDILNQNLNYRKNTHQLVGQWHAAAAAAAAACHVAKKAPIVPLWDI